MRELFGEAIRAGFLLALAWVVLRAMRGRSASLRRAVLVAALFGALLVPLVSQLLARSSAAGLAEFRFDVGALPMLDVGPDAGAEVGPGASQPAPERAAAALVPREAWSRPWPWIGLSWLAGAFVVALRLLTAELALGRLLRSARALEVEPRSALARAQAAIGARARLMLSDAVSVPLTAGVLRPVIVVPAGAERWTEQRWEVVLRHELAHVRQRDVLAQRVAEFVCVLHWFNPLAWWTRARLEVERELAADERVVDSGVLASSYAGELIRVAAEQDGRPLPVRGALAAARRNGLSERVERLVARGLKPLPSRGQSFAVAAGAIVVASFLACASVDTGRPAAPPELGAPAAGAASTIERRIQAIAEAETARLLALAGTHAATVIVLEPSSGHVLALTSPRTAAANYAPGSTLKTLTLAAALEANALDLEHKFDCGGGFREYDGGRRLRDHSSFGALDAQQIIARSSNVGASRLYDLVGGRAFADWFSRFHLDQPAPVELPDRAPGYAGDVAEEPAGSLRGAIAALGSSVATSPLGIAAMYAALANDGVYLAPTLVREQRSRPERLLSAETARVVVEVLIHVVEDPEATGRAARLPGVRVAGKTGTAQVLPLAPGVGEDDSAAYASFVGILPASAPRYVILVGAVIDDPEASGGKIAAPAFARVAEHILALR